MRNDLQSQVDASHCINPGTYTSDQDGDDVDLTANSVYNSAMFCVNVGDHTDGTFTIKFQEKDSGGSYSDIADADLTNGSNSVTVDGSSGNTNTVIRRGYNGDKDLVRATFDVSGGPSTGAEFSALVNLASARSEPV